MHCVYCALQGYEAYKAGDLSKGQYDHRRKKMVAKLKARLGPLTRALNATRMQTEVLRISRTRGRAPTQNITQQIRRMNKLAKYASHGGVVLTGVGLVLACNDIANTDDVQEKNEILAESVGGVIGGIGAGVAVIFMASPAGWVAALVVGAGIAVTSYATGQSFKALYDTYGRKIDIASATGVTHLCRK